MERSAEVLGRRTSALRIALAHLQWVRDYHGDEAVEALIKSVPEERCISFESLTALDRAITVVRVAALDRLPSLNSSKISSVA